MMELNNFQKQVVEVLGAQSPLFMVGGAVRDHFLGENTKDVDLVSYLEPERISALLKEKGYRPLEMGKGFQTISVFEEENRIDIVSIKNLEQDAGRRDFTINALYMNPSSGEILDPLKGLEDLKQKILRACGLAGERFSEDPVRILRMVKLAVKFGLDIEEHTFEEAREKVPLLANVPKERVTSELAEILVLEKAEKAVRMLLELGYWEIFIPELSRLKGLEQNRYHSLDVWEHTLAVFRSTPADLFLRLAGLFHDLGKWETASRECYLRGSLNYDGQNYWIGEFKIVGTRGKTELENKLKPSVGKKISILGSRLDHYPEIVQFKRILNSPIEEGISYVPGGKRHFLNHEKSSAVLLAKVLKKYSFDMFFKGAGKKRERDLLHLVENHMQGTLTFMPELNGKPLTRSFKERAAELVWKIGWDGRDFELQRVHDFLVLWKADYYAGKVHDEEQEKVFDKIFSVLIKTALWQHENLPKLDWQEFYRFAALQNLEKEQLGDFKDWVRFQALLKRQLKPDFPFLQKIFNQYQVSRK
ncbi:MAG: CCA tRNA nucleotidyltransferase [Desulfitobacteriia bacterium]|jgi:tRNA nucleotidyltransferase (CCA-adding enzyme)